MWAQCQDTDRVAAMMCCLQLSRWNIPAVVIVGDALAMEAREVVCPPASLRILGCEASAKARALGDSRGRQRRGVIPGTDRKSFHRA
jgi:hypothetical protein